MSEESKNRKLPDWVKKDIRDMMIDFLISIPTSFILFRILESKRETIFWLFIGIMWVSGSIAKLFSHLREESKFVQIARHIAFVLVSAFFLSLSGVWDSFF